MERGHTIQLLDHGYLKLVDFMGRDEDIVSAARMSTDKAFRAWGPLPCPKCAHTETPGVVLTHVDAGWLGDGAGDPHDVLGACSTCDGTTEVEGDERLLRRLYTDRHDTPFEMCQIRIEVQAPILTFRQWERHRTQSYNEMSGRYTVLPDLYYVPSSERAMAAQQSKTNKQGSMAGFTEAQAEAIRVIWINGQAFARAQYERLLEMGVSRELARLNLPVSQYSRMQVSANLRNWLAFLTLRTADDAQYEIKVYAHAMAEVLTGLYPRTMDLYLKGR